MAKFNKGELVTMIESYDGKGTVRYTNAIVHSAGKKQMVLTSEATGEELGRHFDPLPGSLESATWGYKATFPRMSDEEAVAACLHLGALIVASERASMEHKIELARGRDNTAGYIRALEGDIAKLHEPRVVKG